jgi:NADPH-dependent 2,4-dienoyl-CoA reductase/sulfur reductase-like enzyme
MNGFTRRQFLKLLGATSAFAAAPPALRAATTAPRVVIIGGGFGGATLAKYLKHWGGNIDVTLVDANASHYSCILSNLVVTNAIPMSRITLSYANLAGKYGVTVLKDMAVAIDPDGHKVTLASGMVLPYDRLVLAPGIDFVPIPGWDPNLAPHAWQAGPQTTLLKNQLAAMPTGEFFVMTVPKSPYRCPPGPYERACVVADYLKRRKPGSKVILLDANPGITAEPHNFGTAFSTIYKDVIEYYTNASVLEVDSVNKVVLTSIGSFGGAVLNIIPNQQAGKIVRDTGLTTDPTGRWAPVDVLNYASTTYPDIHVLGDSQASTQPKSGHMASSQAKVCADAMLRGFAGGAPYPAPVTNSACYSPITASTASWLTAVYQYDPASKAMKLVPAAFGEAPAPSGDNYQDMFKWADNIFADSFM